MNSENIRPDLNFFKIRPSLKDDADKIKALGNKIFGNGYLDGWFSQDSSSEDSICLVATRHTSIIGMIYFNRIKDSPKDSRFFQSLMVDQQYRRKGIGTGLYTDALQILAEANVRSLYASCWKESPNSGIVQFLQKKGWEISSVKEKYWYTESLEAGYQCALCGNPCFCTAVLMSMALNN